MWQWDERKQAANRAKHGVSFALAVLVFDDPLHLSRLDPQSDEERWQTVGMAGPVCLFVVHTNIDDRGTGGRIISARRATASERRRYEEDI